MKKNISILVLLINSIIVFAQYNDTLVLKQSHKVKFMEKYYCVIGDTSSMELSFNGKFYQFKQGLPDGMYIAFENKDYIDTSIVAVIEDGKLNGLLIRWENGRKVEISEYENGMRNGWGKLYIYTQEYGKLLNVEYCEDDVCTEIYTEW